MRTIKAGNKNWAVTEVVSKAASAYGCKAVEGAHYRPLCWDHY
jgi:hypothetical protein